jgi:uncharacterized membrane protein YccC
MITWRALKIGLASLVALDPASPGWGVGLRFSVGCGVPPIIGVATDQPALGVFAAIGALFPLLSDIGGTLRERLTLMFATSCAMTLCAAIGALTVGDFWIVLILTALGAFATAWVADMHRPLEMVFRFATVGLVIGSGAQIHAPGAAFAFLCGGLFACLVVIVGYLVRRARAAPPLPTWSRGFQLLLSGRSIAGMRFALCFVAASAIAVAATPVLGLQRGFWITITVLFVMRPDGPQSLKLVLQRFIGTVAGIAVAALIVELSHEPWILILWIIAIGFLAPNGQQRNYALGVGLITAMTMVLLDLALLSQGGDRQLLWVRLVDTGIGCLLAFCGTVIAYPRAVELVESALDASKSRADP